MGLGRFLWRTVGGGMLIDTVKNIVEEGDPIEGVKRTYKETYFADNPITSQIYKAGKYDGKKEGYVDASEEYEKKLLEQADLFLKQKRVFENERNEYESLLDAYEEEIDRLSQKVDRTEAENRTLQQLLLKERELRHMK